MPESVVSFAGRTDRRFVNSSTFPAVRAWHHMPAVSSMDFHPPIRPLKFSAANDNFSLDDSSDISAVLQCHIQDLLTSLGLDAD